MRTILHFSSMLLASLLTLAPFAAHGQQTEVKAHKPELALDYTFLHSNAPPGGCGCFSLNGGSAVITVPLGAAGWGVTGDVSIGHTGNVVGSGNSLTLTTFTVGGVYQPQPWKAPIRPFGHALIGLSHASGSLAQGANPTATNGSAVFAANLGGGLDLLTKHRFAIRLVEADYLVTTFNNNTNNHQNILRLSSGLVLRLGH